MLQIASAIVALAHMSKMAKELIQAIVALYIKANRAWYINAVKSGIIKGVEGDQRELEKAIGSDKAGLPSGHDGVEYRDPTP